MPIRRRRESSVSARRRAVGGIELILNGLSLPTSSILLAPRVLRLRNAEGVPTPFGMLPAIGWEHPQNPRQGILQVVFVVFRVAPTSEPSGPRNQRPHVFRLPFRTHIQKSFQRYLACFAAGRKLPVCSGQNFWRQFIASPRLYVLNEFRRSERRQCRKCPTSLVR